MTPNPTTKKMSEAEVLVVLRSGANNLRSLADKCKRTYLAQMLMIDAFGMEYARSTIESKFAELTQAKESRDVFKMAFDSLLAEHRELRSKHEKTESDNVRLRKEGNELESSLAKVSIALDEAESDRTALIEVVRRLLPYAQSALDCDAVEDRITPLEQLCRDAKAILSRITTPEASR